MSRGDFSNAVRRIVLFGASGQLGSAILRVLPKGKPQRVSWSEVSSLSGPELKSALGTVLNGSLNSDEPTDFVFANGLTDPKMPVDEIRRSNVDFPARVIESIEGFSPASPHRFLTFGTIQENFPDVCRPNPYLNSKLELFERMRGFQALPGCKSRFLHFRIHTLYGGEPKKHMFLGQMLQAIRERKTFAMSSGEQLREYHHADDVAGSVAAVLARNWEFGPFIELNSGKPIRLVGLARAVFQSLDKESLLQVGTLSRDAAENTAKVFPRSPDWLLSRSREPVQGVVAEIRASVESSRR